MAILIAAPRQLEFENGTRRPNTDHYEAKSKLMKAYLKDFKKAADANVFLHPSYQGFQYSDGKDVEARILAILKNAKNVSCASEELSRQITDWPSEYHFSKVRQNLLRHILLTPNDTVLELGGGCGAITRQLGESGAEVTAIEGSLDRAKCAAERCRDLDNVTVFCSNFQEVEFSKQFDVVTLIGVLEYSPAFFDSTEPFLECLRIAYQALKENGRLLIAIENQFGLKYFCGITEDHIPIPYFGIENRYQHKGVRTVGRNDLKQLLTTAGFAGIEFQYPFPDYKLPTVICFESAFSDKEFIPDELFRHLPPRDYSGIGKEQISSSLVWPGLSRNGLVQDLSNSFLIIATKRQADSLQKNENLLAVSYTSERVNGFATATKFVRVEEGHTRVTKEKLYPNISMHSGALEHFITSSKYIPGRTLHSQILDDCATGDFPSAISGISTWLDFITEASSISNSREWDSLLPGAFVDCLPNNLIILNGNINAIDAEWSLTDGITLGNLFLRFIANLGSSGVFLKSLQEHYKRSEFEALHCLITELRFTIPDGAYISYLNMHQLIDTSVYDNKPRYSSRLLDLALSPDPTLRLSTKGRPLESKGVGAGSGLKRAIRAFFKSRS